MSDTNSVVLEIFASFPGRLNAEAAAGMDSVIQYDITGDGGTTCHAIIKNGACSIVDGGHDAPHMTLTMEATDFVQLIQGELDGMTAFMSGKLKVAGDMGLAMKLQTLFQ